MTHVMVLIVVKACVSLNGTVITVTVLPDWPETAATLVHCTYYTTLYTPYTVILHNTHVFIYCSITPLHKNTWSALVKLKSGQFTCVTMVSAVKGFH